MASFEVTTEGINWRRTRTSCIFEIKPPLEWKKTSALNLRGEQVPDPGADSRAEESFLSDRKFSSALDRKKTSDRREVLKRGSKTKNRQADSSNGIEKPDSVGVDVGVRSQEERQKPWIRVMDPGDRQQVIARMSLFMGNEKPPKRFLAWFDGFVSEHKLSPEQVVDALDKAWNRHAAPGQRNNPRSWNWFYETLRNSFIQGYSARLPEQPARDWCMSPGTVAEMAAGFDPLGDEGIAWDRRGKETPCNAT